MKNQKAIQFLEEEIGECHDNPNIDNEIIAELMVKFSEKTRRRDDFAARAMQAIIECTFLEMSFPDVACEAYQIADAMMEERE